METTVPFGSLLVAALACATAVMVAQSDVQPVPQAAASVKVVATNTPGEAAR